MSKKRYLESTIKGGLYSYRYAPKSEGIFEIFLYCQCCGKMIVAKSHPGLIFHFCDTINLEYYDMTYKIYKKHYDAGWLVCKSCYLSNLSDTEKLMIMEDLENEK